MINNSKSYIDLSIIIVNYNTKKKLDECLYSLYNNISNISFEVIVSDNHSLDDSINMLEKNYPEVSLIKNERNLGFAKANNKALSIVKGKYILLLNSDTIVPKLSISNMIDFLRNHKEVGAVGAKMLYPDHTTQRTARRFPNPMAFFFGRKSILTLLMPENRFSKRYMMYDREQQEEPYEVDWVSGAGLMVKKEVVQQVGLLDERFFIYWEDADWCFRIKQKGWKIFCIPTAPIIHHEGGSSNNCKLKLIMHFHKSVFLFYRKHYIKSNLNPMCAIAAVGLSFRALILCIISILGTSMKRLAGQNNGKLK